jgi:hypothetical protein
VVFQHANTWKQFTGDKKMKVFLAILSSVVAIAIGISSTFYVMTRVLDFQREPEKSFYEPGEGNAKKGKGMRGMPGGKGGKDAMPGKGKFGKDQMPGGGKDGKDGAPNGT